MITVRPEALFMLYFLFVMSGVFGTWLAHVLKKKEKLTTPPLHFTHKCEYCHNIFQSPQDLATFECPQCHLLNQRTISD